MNVLRNKIKTVGSKLLGKGSEEIPDLKLHHNDIAMIEDDLKPEYDVLNNLIKLVNSTKVNLEKIFIENVEMKSTIETLKSQLLGKRL